MKKSEWTWNEVDKTKMRSRSCLRGSRSGDEGYAWGPMKKPSHRLRGSSAASEGRPSYEVVGELIEEEICDCGFCAGTGEFPTGSTCPVCKGRSNIKINPPGVKCAFCKGIGKAQTRSMITCLVCKGKGVVSVTKPIETCSQCNGTGRSGMSSSLACGKCKGKGVVTVKEVAGEGASGEKRFIRSPSGSERDVAKALCQLGGDGSVAQVSAKTRVTTNYVEYLCKSMVDRGYVERIGVGVYALTPGCEKAMEQIEINDLEKVTSEERKFLSTIGEVYEDLTAKQIADMMGEQDVRRVLKMCKSMGKKDLVDVSLSGKISITPKGEKAIST